MNDINDEKRRRNIMIFLFGLSKKRIKEVQWESEMMDRKNDLF